MRPASDVGVLDVRSPDGIEACRFRILQSCDLVPTATGSINTSTLYGGDGGGPNDEPNEDPGDGPNEDPGDGPNDPGRDPGGPAGAAPAGG